MNDFATQPEAAAAEPADVVTQPDPTPPAQEEYNPEDFYAEDKPKVDANAADPDAEPQGGEGEEGEDDPKPIDAPLSWAKDAKEVFATLPPEAQKIISEREVAREAALQTKFREAASTRQQVETEARTALQTIMQNHYQQLAQYQQQFEAPQPDLRLLNSDDPNERALYFQQEAQYRAASAQREHITQQMREAEAHAQAIADQQQAAELQAEHQFLEEKLGTEWSDPSARAKLLGDLGPIAAELGYPQELIANARGVDILAMRQAATWKADAFKYRELMKRKMEPVRAAKSIPPASRPGSPAGQRQPQDVVSQMYPNDVRRN